MEELLARVRARLASIGSDAIAEIAKHYDH